MTHAFIPPTCPHCPASPTTYATLGELEAHRFTHHERPWDPGASWTRLALTSGMIGRPAPTTPPAPSAVAWSRAWYAEQAEGKAG